jgi:hypothetical protein
MRDVYGDSKSSCRWGRQRACCCNAPDGDNPFLPVKLEYLFPQVPPASNRVKYDLQKNYNSVGFVLIDGSTQAVSSLNKRDGSHLRFLDCHTVVEDKRQSLRFVCSHHGPGSNCDQMMEGGIEGTVVKMPDNCGPGEWAVAHGVAISLDQSLPEEYGGLRNTTVLDLTFDYNFGLVRRDSGEIALRIDYSNDLKYWDSVVNVPGSLKKRGFGNDAWWKSKLSDLRGDDGRREIIAKVGT